MTGDTLRLILLAQCCIALIAYGLFIGTIINAAATAHSVILFGVFGLLTYSIAGQVKALRLGIIFDGYSWLGLSAVTVLNIGLIWFLWERRPRPKG